MLATDWRVNWMACEHVQMSSPNIIITHTYHLELMAVTNQSTHLIFNQGEWKLVTCISSTPKESQDIMCWTSNTMTCLN